MTEETYKTGMALLQKLFGKIDYDAEVGKKEMNIRYKIYWNFFKSWSDKVFIAVCEELAMSFSPTSFIPFPVPGQFNKAKDLIIKRTQYTGLYLPYKPLNVADSELPTSDFMEEFLGTLPPMIKNSNRLLNGKYSSNQ